MLFTRKGLAAALLPAALIACARNQETQTVAFPAPSAASVPAITEADLKERLYLIADDSMGGRATGSVGHNKTVQYIAAELKRFGLRPAGENGTYFQKVPYVRRTLDSSLLLDGQALKPGEDFVIPVGDYKSLDNVQVIYGGMVTDSTTWITPDQAAGKLVVLAMTPGDRRIFGGIGNSPRWRTAAAVAITGFGPLFPNLARFFPGTGMTLKSANATPANPSPYLSDAGAEKLLGAPLSSVARGTVGKTVSATFNATEAPLDVFNVMAVLPGTDATLRNQYVAIGSHSDHVGMGGPGVDHDSLHIFLEAARRATITGRSLTADDRSRLMLQLDSIRKIRAPRRDSIRNGADDDASGTVGLIEIAESMARGTAKPRRSVLFVWHAAEEAGMIGSGHFVDHPTIARDSIVAALNIDMIGRGGVGEEPGGGPDYLQLIGWRRLSNELGDVIEKVNSERRQPFKFDLEYDKPGHSEQYYCRSDHWSYARYNIPVAFFSTGSHGDYHQVTDEPQYIDYTKLMNVSQLIHDVGMRLASNPGKPVIDGPRTPNPNAQCRQ